MLIQTSMIREAFNSDSDVWWWVKGDGVDVVKGIGESVRGDWSGNVDLNDGALDALFLEYRNVLRETAEIGGLGQRQQSAAITEDLTVAMGNLKHYLTFISKSKLLKVIIKVNSFSAYVLFLELFFFRHNLPQKLSGVRNRLQEIIKGVYRFKRVPASHVFVLMISSELRNKKAYAVPIQCLPYAGLKEADMRRMVKLVVQEMLRHGMKVAGKHAGCIIYRNVPCLFSSFTCRLCNEW